VPPTYTHYNHLGYRVSSSSLGTPGEYSSVYPLDSSPQANTAVQTALPTYTHYNRLGYHVSSSILGDYGSVYRLDSSPQSAIAAQAAPLLIQPKPATQVPAA
jgi:hypothetical protein